jgi:hypothetical protein
VVINNGHRDFVYTKSCQDSPVLAVYRAAVLTDPPPRVPSTCGHSDLIPAVLMRGHHFSISAL